MAEPTSGRDQIDEDLNEKLVEILKPELEAAATEPPSAWKKSLSVDFGGCSSCAAWVAAASTSG